MIIVTAIEEGGINALRSKELIKHIRAVLNPGAHDTTYQETTQ
jgi:hypothetical protein